MKLKTVHPIIYFSLLFVILVAIQSYFLYNTVLLKKNEITSKVNEIFEKSVVNYTFLEDTRWDESLHKWQDFETKEEAQLEFHTKMKSMNDSIAPILNNFLTEQYQKTGLLLAFKKELLSVYDIKHNKQLVTQPIVIYTTNPQPITNHLLSESKWESTYTNDTTVTERDTLSTTNLQNKIDIARIYEKSTSKVNEHSFVIQQAMYYDVLNMNQLLFKDLWGLFLVSIILLILVLWLYYQSYKKYEEQRSQVLLLHDTIDNVAHEFKTPLATLKIASKQIRMSKNEETFNVIDRQIIRLENLVKPLDDVEVNDKKPNQQYVLRFLNDIKSIHDQIIFEESVTIDTELSLNVDEFESLVGNLIDNSIKYGSTTVDIVVLQKDNRNIIKVKDDGFGISKHDQAYIFDKYFRVATNNLHNTKGLGVGLYIVHKIVMKHNGKIDIKSDLGKGCEFIIEL